MERGTALLDELTEGALRAQAALGDPPPWMPVLEHETRIHSHDILSPHHEKGYRCLRAFPPASLRKLRLQFWRVTPSKASKLDHLVGVDAGPDAPLLTFLVWREHLRLVWHDDASVESKLAADIELNGGEVREYVMHGWDVLMEAADPAAPLVPHSNAACVRCRTLEPPHTI